MSILDKLKDFQHTFTAWVAKEYAKLYSAAPKIDAVASTVLKYAIGAAQIIVAAEVGQPEGEMVGAIGNEVVSDLHVASSLIYDFGPNPTATTIITGAQNNLAGLLTAGHIKNADNAAKVTKVVNSLGALVANLPQTAPAS